MESPDFFSDRDASRSALENNLRELMKGLCAVANSAIQNSFAIVYRMNDSLGREGYETVIAELATEVSSMSEAAIVPMGDHGEQKTLLSEYQQRVGHLRDTLSLPWSAEDGFLVRIRGELETELNAIREIVQRIEERILRGVSDKNSVT